MIDIICVLCDNNQETRILYPATFKRKHLSSRLFSARRIPDKIHYQILKCKGCGLFFSSPILPPAEIIKLYQQSCCNYQKQIPYLTETYLKLFFKAKPFLPKNPKVLEIGCASGFFLEALRQNGVRHLFGVEPSQTMVSLASKSLQSRIKIAPFKPGLFAENYFDLICSFHTLDHIVDVNEFVEQMFKILTPKGIGLIVVHNTGSLLVKLLGESSPIFDIEHIYLFNKETLRRIFTRHNFSIRQVFDVVNTYPFWYWLRMSGLPVKLRAVLQRVTTALRLYNFPLSISGGSIGVIVQKTIADTT